jgi:hypothetical protein
MRRAGQDAIIQLRSLLGTGVFNSDGTFPAMLPQVVYRRSLFFVFCSKVRCGSEYLRYYYVASAD